RCGKSRPPVRGSFSNVVSDPDKSSACLSVMKLSERSVLGWREQAHASHKPPAQLASPYRGLSLSLDFLWLSAHVSGQLEESPWLTNQWVSLIRGRLKSFGTIQAAPTVSCSGSLS